MVRGLWTCNERHTTTEKDRNHGGEGAKDGTEDH